MENLAELAAQFVNTTKGNIFLTGKAGTGKTTFLRDIAKATHKNFVIVAPTGIAALNAQGVTIHSQFLFPFGSYLTEPTDFTENPQSNFFSRTTLARKHPLNSVRKQVLRGLDLLIIDEVSMLRADLLDAIDYRLKAAKSNYHTPFGGVQLLLIGDLFQLPPIVRDGEWSILKDFYPSIHFFESHALKKAGYTYIELDKVYRQSDETFIKLLNNLRNNACTPADLALLNKHTEVKANPKNITLTTHNRQADEINTKALENLPGKAQKYSADVKGDFPNHLFPLPETLEIKVNSRVMFTRNDGDGGRYYNGKIATVIKLNNESIFVHLDGEEGDELLEVPKHEWGNKKYNVNAKTKDIEEEQVGSFKHFPLKLAWAITVHKSQGLTFDGANLLVSRAFAPGQVYVALSRLRSLDGLHLSNPIPASAIMSDVLVGKMAQTHKAVNLAERLSVEQRAYLRFLYHEAFSLQLLSSQLKYFVEKLGPQAQFEEPLLDRVVEQVYETMLPEVTNVAKFMHQLDRLLQEESEDFQDRLKKGIDYYGAKLREHLKTILLFKQRLDTLSKTKTLVTGLDELDQAITLNIKRLYALPEKIEQLNKGEAIVESPAIAKGIVALRDKLFEEVEQIMKDQPLKIKGKTAKKKKALPKGATYEETYGLVEQGFTVEEIAEKRKMATSTIEGHIARGISEGRFLADKFLNPSEMVKIETAFKEVGAKGLNAVYAHLNREVSFGALRMVQAGLKKEER